MPNYDMVCPKRHLTQSLISFRDFDDKSFGCCDICGDRRQPVAGNLICVYGTEKFHDRGLSDASEAAGRPITSTKEADRLERDGKMCRVTNPSRHRLTADERKKERDRLARIKLERAI